jgi:hypothetical protein
MKGLNTLSPMQSKFIIPYLFLSTYFDKLPLDTMVKFSSYKQSPSTKHSAWIDITLICLCRIFEINRLRNKFNKITQCKPLFTSVINAWLIGRVEVKKEKIETICIMLQSDFFVEGKLTNLVIFIYARLIEFNIAKYCRSLTIASRLNNEVTK